MHNLETKELLIRKPKLSDVEICHKKWFSNPEIAHETDFREHKSVVETKSTILSAMNGWEYDLPIWIIENKKEGEIIGYIKISTASKPYKKCTILYYIIDKYCEKYSVEVLSTVIAYIFNEEVYENIIYNFYDINEKTTIKKEKILKQIGMKKEGVLRNRRRNLNTGKIENLIIYSILKEEYLENLEEKQFRNVS